MTFPQSFTSGTAVWSQVINTISRTFEYTNGDLISPPNITNALDNDFQYQGGPPPIASQANTAGGGTADGPHFGIFGLYAKTTFSASMYYIWKPATEDGPEKGPPIYVPLGEVDWNFFTARISIFALSTLVGCGSQYSSSQLAVARGGARLEVDMEKARQQLTTFPTEHVETD